MNALRQKHMAWRRSVTVALTAGLTGLMLHLWLMPWSSPLLNDDQRGAALMARGRHAEAAETFILSNWKAAALYRAGEFKQAAMVLPGIESARARYNTGNTLCMQGLYADAVPQYEQALLAQPDWQDARINLEIARQGAARTKREGGEQLSEIGADKIVFDKQDPSKGTEDNKPTEAQAMGDAEMRAMWLRHVQTTPSQFLKSKFAYQVHVRKAQPKDGGP